MELLVISLNVEDNYLLLNVSVLSQINESIGDSIIWNTQLKSKSRVFAFDKSSEVFAFTRPVDV